MLSGINVSCCFINVIKKNKTNKPRQRIVLPVLFVTLNLFRVQRFKGHSAMLQLIQRLQTFQYPMSCDMVICSNALF